MRVALVDYRAGNLASVRKAFAACGADVFCPRVPTDLSTADLVVVPGVGHFEATEVLDESWREAFKGSVAAGRPFLGICLGLQWLFDGSEEAPGLVGLGWFRGECALLGGGRFVSAPSESSSPEIFSSVDGRARAVKVPHVGWNSLEIVRPSVLLAGVANRAQAYFTHSYAAPVTDVTVATTSHGGTFASVVERGRVFGVQFHPEKSGEIGLRVLANFLALSG
jgi:glutamine amidotransferase